MRFEYIKVLQCVLHIPQVDFAFSTAESAVKVQTLVRSWGMRKVLRKSETRAEAGAWVAVIVMLAKRMLK